jgi:hypothetical protein
LLDEAEALLAWLRSIVDEIDRRVQGLLADAAPTDT